MRKRVAILVAGTALAGAGGVAAWYHVRAMDEVAAVTAPLDDAKPTAERIAAMLASPDFKERVQARRQIEGLPPDQRAPVLEALAGDERAEVRLLAVSALGGMDDRSRFVDLLKRLATGDPDPDVRAAAAQLAGGAP